MQYLDGIGMSNIQYTPSDEIVTLVEHSLMGINTAETMFPVIKESIKNTLASLFATIARCEASDSTEVHYSLTHNGIFTDNFRTAVFDRIPLDIDCIDKFFQLLTDDLYEASVGSKIHDKDRIGGKWGYLNCYNREIDIVIEYRKPKPTTRPDWVKAGLV